MSTAAWQQGWATGERLAERGNAHKQQLSDEERSQHLSDYNNIIGNIQQKLSTVDKNKDPDTYNTLNTQLDTVVGHRTALFHPDNGPGALAHLGKMVWEKVHGKTDAPTSQATDPAATLASTTGGTTPTLPAVPGGSPTAAPSARQAPTAAIPGVDDAKTPSMGGGFSLPATPGQRVTQRPQTPADLKQRMATDLSFGAQPPANPGLLFRKQLQETLPNMTQEELDHAVRIHEGVDARPIAQKSTWKPLGKPFQGDGGVYYQTFQDAQGETKKEALSADFKPPVITPHQSSSALESFIRSQFPNGESTAQRVWAMRYVADLMHGNSKSSHESLQFDGDGNPHIVTLNNSTTKDYGPIGPPPPNEPKPSVSAPTGTFVSASYSGGQVPGMLAPGNVDLASRPTTKNSDGSHSTVFSMSSEIDGKEVMYPGVGDGVTYPLRKLTPAEALDQYTKTKKNLGVFATPEAANKYAKTLHEDQAQSGEQAPAPAATPGSLKRRAAAIAPTQAAAGEDPRLAGLHKATPVENAAKTTLKDARHLNSLAQQAADAKSAVQDKRLAFALAKLAAGRFNTQEYDVLVRQNGLANSWQQWLNNQTSGALTDDIRNQLVAAAHTELVAAQEGLDEIRKPTGGGGGEGSTKKHSLSKAMKLQFNQGKSEADVRKDLESHGYEVIP